MNKFIKNEQKKYEKWEHRSNPIVSFFIAAAMLSLILLIELLLAGISLGHLLIPMIIAAIISYYGWKRNVRKSKEIWADIGRTVTAEGLVPSDWQWTGDRQKAWLHDGNMRDWIVIIPLMFSLVGAFLFPGFFFFDLGLLVAYGSAPFLPAIIGTVISYLLFGYVLIMYRHYTISIAGQRMPKSCCWIFGADPRTAQGAEKLAIIRKRIKFLTKNKAVKNA